MYSRASPLVGVRFPISFCGCPGPYWTVNHHVAGALAPATSRLTDYYLVMIDELVFVISYFPARNYPFLLT